MHGQIILYKFSTTLRLDQELSGHTALLSLLLSLYLGYRRADVPRTPTPMHQPNARAQQSIAAHLCKYINPSTTRPTMTMAFLVLQHISSPNYTYCTGAALRRALALLMRAATSSKPFARASSTARPLCRAPWASSVRTTESCP